MKITVNKLALISIFALTACSSWFEENEPLPSELGQRTPSLNSSTPSAFPDPMNASYANGPIDAMMPPMGSMPAAPEPPSFIGSTGVQTAAATIPVQQTGLPMLSPVDMSAANNAATGLPVQRRAPAFNQSLGIVPEGKNHTEFPKLSQIPPAPIAPISAEADSRVIQMKADLNASKNRIMPVDAPYPPVAPVTVPALAQVTPKNPIAPIAPETSYTIPARQPKVAVAPITPVRPEGPSTNFANLKPLPNEPIYKIADAPKVIAERPRVLNTQGAGSMEVAHNVTRLSDLRPISGNHRPNYGVKYTARNSSPAGGKARMGIARHSTYYGEY